MNKDREMIKTIFMLIERHKELIQLEDDFLKWQKENPDKYSWEYKKKRPTKAELKRYRLLIRELMIEFEGALRIYG
ncbi:hypothetical protein QVA60_01620 [Staphylococcus chromogenes]|uniref:hypothetical protein n=1 Tax=Staphylococcus chromogenes TaxID=46126 RepID=UPI002901BF60|nr:hypothetical protein [Staphylococcus chromogenes]MDU0429184.1 hypothetical protein [Staphylococcus chromogenes]